MSSGSPLPGDDRPPTPSRSSPGKRSGPPPNKIKGVCPCGEHVHPEEGFWLSAYRQTWCSRCFDKDQERVAALKAKPATGNPGQQECRSLIRIFYAPKLNVAFARTFDISRTNRETFDAACKSAGCSYSKELGYHCQISVLPDLIDILQSAKLRVEVADSAADALINAASNARKSTSAADVRLVMSGRRGKKLKDYQRIGVDFFAGHRLAFNADDGGLGKSAQALLAAPQNPRILIICPNAMKGAVVGGKPVGGWADEIAAWRPDIKKVTILDGRDSFRWPEANEAIILNFAILPPTADEVLKKSRVAHAQIKRGEKSIHVGTPAGIPPEGVYLIVDEAHELGNPKSQQTKRVKRISIEVVAKGGWVRGLSATPFKNDPEELYSVYDALCMAQPTFGSYQNFRDLHGGTWEPCGRGRQRWKWSTEPSPEIPERLKRTMIRRRKRDVLHELPPLTMRRIMVDIDKATLKLCDRALMDLEKAGISLDEALKTADEARDGLDITMISKALEALSRLKTPHALERAAVLERAGTPCLVFGANTVVVDAFVDRPGWGTIQGTQATVCLKGVTKTVKRPEVVSLFQAGKIEHGVACTIQSSGVGLTFTRASDVILASRVWSPQMVAQAIWRVERIGQKNPMCVTDFVANHPLDLRMSEVLEEKMLMFAATVDAASVDADDITKRHDPGAKFIQAAELRVTRKVK